jgi:hypothetical protein
MRGSARNSGGWPAVDPFVMLWSRLLGGRAAATLAVLALAVQASLPLFLAVQLGMHATAHHTATASVPLIHPDHHCTCPTCQILAACQSFPLVPHPILAVAQPAPDAPVGLESAQSPSTAFASSYQARAPPVVG